jgi:hypothetical protein
MTREDAEAQVEGLDHEFSGENGEYIEGRCFGTTYIAYLLRKLNVPEDKSINFKDVAAGWTVGYLRAKAKDFPESLEFVFTVATACTGICQSASGPQRIPLDKTCKNFCNCAGPGYGFLTKTPEGTIFHDGNLHRGSECRDIGDTPEASRQAVTLI